MAKKENKNEITVAIITLVSAVMVAAISNVNPIMEAISKIVTKVEMIMSGNPGPVTPIMSPEKMESEYKLGVSQLDSGDYKNALKTFLPLAIYGDKRAQYQMGKIYYYDRPGIDKNYDVSFQWFKKSANQNLPEALHNLGVMYKKGQGVKPDKDMANFCYTKAAKQGYIPSQLALTAAGKTW